ncbi:hypothetical protein A0J61_10955 [Choanephora cucurbitarum]|uniref:Uncharacterized protein n=1 Tax=Choanephora cucurbitarum TaxID=101091 RepID=A0A1C7MX13_9FUNG|nr:hypothetical protein A0J61_10955 [Choanephora cucurbitarum]
MDREAPNIRSNGSKNNNRQANSRSSLNRMSTQEQSNYQNDNKDNTSTQYSSKDTNDKNAHNRLTHDKSRSNTSDDQSTKHSNFLNSFPMELVPILSEMSSELHYIAKLNAISSALPLYDGIAGDDNTWCFRQLRLFYSCEQYCFSLDRY